jgi:hypothetical protein
MPDTAIDPVPTQGKFRRALAAVGAWLQALDYTGFDYTLDRIKGLEQGTHPASTPGRRDLPLRIAQAATAALGSRCAFQFQGSRSATLLAG